MEKHVLEISKRLVKKGHKVIIVTEEINTSILVYQYHDKSAKTTGELKNIKTYRIKTGSNEWLKKFRIWFWLFTHLDLIKRADVVHAHDVFFWYFPFRFLFPTKPAFVTFHGWETVFPPTTKAKIVRKISEILSNGNICIGDYIKKWYGTHPTYVTYGAAEVSSIKYKVLREKTKKLKIILIGRFAEDIGVKIYLEALELLKKNNIPFEFLAFGSGELKWEIKKYGRVGAFSTQTVEKAIANSDIVFASSYLSMFMAMQQKKPIFSIYTNPLKKDYLAMAPFAKWINICGSKEELYNAMIKNSKFTQKQMAESAHEWIKDQMWEKVTDLYLKLWNKQE